MTAALFKFVIEHGKTRNIPCDECGCDSAKSWWRRARVVAVPGEVAK
jgi:hypothetical protein